MLENKFDRLEERVSVLEKLLNESLKVQKVLEPLNLTKNSNGVFEEVPVIVHQPNSEIQGF